jgi:hypothetical protein
LIFVLLGVGVVAGVGYTLHSVSADPQKKIYATTNGTITVNGKSYKHSYVTEIVSGDPTQVGAHGAKGGSHLNWPSYGPSTHIVLPTNAYVTMTLHVYDSGEKLNNSYFANVIGTTDGNMTYDGKNVSNIPSDQVEHTFTLHSLPTRTQDPLFVNVPLPRVQMDDKGNPVPTSDAGTNKLGHTVTFSFITPSRPGEYVWNCEYPCGDGTYAKFGAVMGSAGYMSGKVSVVNV